MEYAITIIVALAFAAAYASLIPYRRDLEKTVAELEKQTNSRIRFY